MKESQKKRWIYFWINGQVRDSRQKCEIAIADKSLKSINEI